GAGGGLGTGVIRVHAKLHVAHGVHHAVVAQQVRRIQPAHDDCHWDRLRASLRGDGRNRERIVAERACLHAARGHARQKYRPRRQTSHRFPLANSALCSASAITVSSPSAPCQVRGPAAWLTATACTAAASKSASTPGDSEKLLGNSAESRQCSPCSSLVWFAAGR